MVAVAPAWVEIPQSHLRFWVRILTWAHGSGPVCRFRGVVDGAKEEPWQRNQSVCVVLKLVSLLICVVSCEVVQSGLSWSFPRLGVPITFPLFDFPRQSSVSSPRKHDVTFPDSQWALSTNQEVAKLG